MVDADRGRVPGTAGGSLPAAWTRAFIVGELVGFVPPAATGAALAALGASDPVFVIGLTVAGLLEGLALGVAQAVVLDDHRTGIDPAAWVRATVLAAGLAWFVGMGGSAVVGASGSPWLLVVVAPLWAAGLVSMGYLQWRVLRRVHPRSGRWVPVTAGAWLVGVAIPVVALSLIPNSWPLVAHFATAVVAAVLMGVTVGRLTGHTLARLVADERPAG